MLIETLGHPATMVHTFVDQAGRRVAYVTTPRAAAPPDWEELRGWTITLTTEGVPETVCAAADIETYKDTPHAKFLLRAPGNGWRVPTGSVGADPQEFRFTAPDGASARFRRTETGYYERATRD